MVSHWAIWMIVDQNKIYLNLMCFKIPHKLEVGSLHRQALPFWSEFLLRAVWTVMTWAFYNYYLGQRSSRDLEFFWDIPQDLEKTKCPWGQYYMVRRFVICVAQDMYNLGVFCLPFWAELWKIHHQNQHKIEVRHDKFLGLESELLILHEMVSDQYISLHMSGVTTWLVQIYLLKILHPRHKMDSPMCGDF